MSALSPPTEIVILSDEYTEYQQALQRLAPASELIVTSASDDPGTVDVHTTAIMLADPHLAATIVDKCSALKWLQLGWAGVTPLLRAQNRSYTLTGVKGVFDMQMREYVFSYLLYFSRNIAGFQKAAESAENKWYKPEHTYLKGKTLGVLGAGSIASALAPVAQVFGMKLVGLRKSGHPHPGFNDMYDNTQLQEFARQCDYLVSLLPDTPHTRGLLDKTLFNALPENAVLINAGRGNALVQQDLLDALEEGQLQAAVLDVFEQEPLPDTHPFWLHPDIHVTQHTAATSIPADIAKLFYDNLQRYRQGQALQHAIDFEKGY
ncbi:D-2-hydroxyacid dehydrogenase [Salinimonas marina]|uniref:D-2-hydroxyacid dehydrogenase n=1 Tax=Salinimonas marina TaxID=2785918 RepID=A0A7S9DYY9_9ALTE|nr:D-2-hydroxyacid dehydrogenase [Salinimonas marina]QPG06213.1 D-2-hydroxyacid dehydrogenase [Salinimonas marina]